MVVLVLILQFPLRGVLGVQGARGVLGVQAALGVLGVQGARGVLGVQGARGVPGVQGVPEARGVLPPRHSLRGAGASGAEDCVLWASGGDGGER
ncbi:MAG: hypothetical protein CMP27_07955 [Roseibacillus sp.]|nr:hypothetical protein [Roseibacillus sp.]